MLSTIYDPFDPATVRDPYPAYAWMRAEDPVHYNPERDLWAITRWADVYAVARDHESFSSAEGVTYPRVPSPMLISLDPPDHTRVRQLAARDFTPKATERWRDLVHDVARRMLDVLVGPEPIDLATAYAAPYPVEVIATIMGIPLEDRDAFRHWSDGVVLAFGDLATLTEEQTQHMTTSIFEIADYFREVVERRRADPGDDLISRVAAYQDEGRIEPLELVLFCQLLLVAGNETTTNLISNLVHALIEHPDQWALLKRDRSLVPSAVEEALRYDAPIQGMYRTAVRDADVGGVVIPAGSRVVNLWGSANRDDARFADPDRFDVRRDPDDHLAFGFGIHRCLGAHLARMEAQATLTELLDRCERIELAGAAARSEHSVLRGFSHLPVRFHAGRQ